jgi:predicted site-specific integrase-resolvase
MCTFANNSEDNMADYKEIYTTAELAKRFRVSEATIRRKVRDGDLIPIKGLSQPYRFTHEEVRRFMYGKEEAGAK